MNLKKILGNMGCAALSTVAPPFGGMAAAAIKKVLKIPESSTEEEMARAIEMATPAQLLALKQAENDFKQQMKELDIDLARIDMHDRKSARKREEKVGGFTNPLIAGIVILGFFGALAYIFSGKVDISGQAGALIGTLVGYASAKADQVVSYYFGSSVGSAEKNKLLTKSTK